ncbi:MAG: protoheme IX farnesyltransferase [Anaerolineales bacterium]|nr:protoheme IX farnesyltransferase [Anaerolineales bacterium]
MSEIHRRSAALGIALPATSAGAHSGSMRASAWVGLLVALFKVRVVGLVAFTAVTAMVVAADGVPSAFRLGWLALAGTLAGAGAGALNHYLDRDVDAVMIRTRGRPLPAGQIRPPVALAIGLVLVLAGTGLAAGLGLGVGLYVGMAWVTYVLAYTRWLKRRTPWNVVIGGWTGSCAVLAGWEAAGGGLSLTAWALAGVVFLWTPAHFWAFAIARADDYRRAGIPMLPVVAGAARAAQAIVIGALLSLGISLLPGVVAATGWAYLAPAFLAGAAFVAGSLWLWREPSQARAWVVYKVSNAYLLFVFVGVLADVAIR